MLNEATHIEINVTSVPTDDVQKALDFYTNVLDFEQQTDEPVGGTRWLTVTGPGSSNGVELLLEPIGIRDVAEELVAYCKSLVAHGIPWTIFGCGEVPADYERRSALGVEFTQEPMTTGDVTRAIFDDTCANLTQFAQQ